MKYLTYLAAALALSVAGLAAGLEKNITAEAAIVTKAGLRAHVAAGDDAPLHPATYAELAAALGDSQPSYLIVRFKTTVPGHYSGEAEARRDGGINGTKLNVVLHYNKGWVEYYIPLDSVSFPQKPGSPSVTVHWNKLETK
jgi:hypothetical protein